MIVGSKVSRWVADSVIIILLLLVVIALMRRGRPSATKNFASAIRPGKRLALNSVNWAASPATLVLGLSETCHYCEASLPFYRQISEYNARKSGKLQLVALLPQPAPEALAYLHKNGIKPDQVQQVNLPAVGIFETPTLALADRNGNVSDLWIGQLSPAQEENFWVRLRGEKSSTSTQDFPKYLSESQLEALKTGGAGIVLLDIRSREKYAADHRAGTQNLPWDELDSRASIELPKDKIIVVDCEDVQPFYCDGAANLLARSRFSKVAILGDGRTAR